ncbi:MAG: hypothetical protein QNL93_05025 [Opitutae bacterium]
MSFKLALFYKMNTMKGMNIIMLLSFLACIFLFSSCQNSYRQNVPIDSNSQGIVGVGDDAYQVTSEEYGNYFESRYGLLHQKFNDRPFTGRILTIEKGESGDYVLADESWKEGKKDDLSTRWFSNGIKMYERNYSDGRWHGTVTRWWPNGQKMYVRAYTNGARHGKEATWRSDGSPIQLAEKPYIIQNKKQSINSKDTDDFAPTVNAQTEDFPSAPTPNVNFDSQVEPIVNEPFPSLPETDSGSTIDSFPSSDTISSDGFPSFPNVPQESSLSTPTNDGFPSLPGNEDSPSLDLPVISESPQNTFPALPESNEFPATPQLSLPSNDEGLPSLPSFPTSDGNELPALPGSSSIDEGLPPLPGFPEDADNTLPPLPGLPGSAGDEFPSLPDFPTDESGGLPPLPGADSSDGGLPPLPPLPE